MGKTSKWIKRFLVGKKDKDKEKNNTIATNVQVDDTLALNALPKTTTTVSPTPPAKEKRRWSIRRSSTTTTPPNKQPQESETEHKVHVLEMDVTLDAAVVEAKADDAVMESTTTASDTLDAIEQSAAIKIQSFYRGCLARKALNALRGLVKLQALVRGHLVRKQAAATLRCMQALIKVQSRARAQRLHMVEESKSYDNQKPSHHRKLSYDFKSHSFQDLDVAMEECVKIVEMDSGDSKPNIRRRNNHSTQGNGNLLPFEHIISTPKSSTKHNQLISLSPSPSSRTDQTPRTSSNHFEDYSFNTAQSSPQNASQTKTNHAESIYREYPQFYPSYMANTQSSKAKLRSHSAPKSRPETYERQSSGRRRGSVEGRNVPRGVKMQRSASHFGAQNHQNPWSINLDKSTFSLKASECGSNSTVLSNAKYCRSVGWI